MNCWNCGTIGNKHGHHRHGTQRYKCTQCFRTYIESRRGSHWTPHWKRDLIKGLWTSGLSIRQISALVGVATDTVHTYADGHQRGNCDCGKPAGHKGWCKPRIQQSARRQKYLQSGEVNSALPGLYHIRICPVCHEPIEKALRHRPCVLKATKERDNAEELAYRPIRLMEQQIRATEDLLKQIGEITNGQ